MQLHKTILLIVLILAMGRAFSQSVDSGILEHSMSEPVADSAPDVRQVPWIYIQRKISRDSFLAMQSGKDFGYMLYIDSLLREREKTTIAPHPGVHQQEKSAFANWLEKSGLNYIIMLGASVLLFLLLWNIFGKNVIFQKSNKRLIPGVLATTTDSEPAYQLLLDLQQKSIQAKEYRHATRYLLLVTLHQLGQTGKLDLAPNKTNTQYLLELNSADIRNDFSLLIRHFERVWYGQFVLQKEQFHQIHDDYKAFAKKWL